VLRARDADRVLAEGGVLSRDVWLETLEREE
jgi:hypothetical protein